MRICLYTGSALPKLGGQEAVVDALARHLQRLGHEPIVLAPRPRLPLRPRDRDLPYRVLRHPRFYSTEHLVEWYRWFLLRAHRRHRFEIVHCHDVYPTGYLAMLCRQSLGVPVVVTSHGGDIRAGNRLLARPRVAQKIGVTLDGVDALISIGPFTSVSYVEAGSTGDNVHLIPNGVDFAPLQVPAARPIDMDRAVQPGKYVLFLGRLAERKGIDTLLTALARVPPTASVQLVIAGTGDLRGQLEALAHELKVHNRVRFVGRVAGPAKAYLLQNAVAVAMPSRGWEAFPLVVLEAFAAGRPVLASDIPGLSDLVEDHVTGLRVAPENVIGWGEALVQALGEPDWVAAAGRAARGVAAGYDWPTIAARHVELYRKLIADQTRADMLAGRIPIPP